MILSEIEKWRDTYIIEVYHQRVHSSLKMSPIRKYEEGIFGTADKPGTGLPHADHRRRPAAVSIGRAARCGKDRDGILQASSLLEHYLKRPPCPSHIHPSARRGADAAS